MKKAMRFKAAWPVWGGGATVCRKMCKVWAKEWAKAEREAKRELAGRKP